MHYCMYLRKSRADIHSGMDVKEVLKRHEDTLYAVAKAMGISIDTVYREVVSGENIADRPMMKTLLSEVEQGIWNGVFVMEIERLARGNTIDQGIIIQAFQHSKTKIITPIKTYAPEDEYDEEYFEFSLFMSRREYKTINRRMQRGRLASIHEGKYPASTPPFGYQKIKLPQEKGFTLSPIPQQAKVVTDIFTAYAGGMTAAAIAELLNQKGIRTAKGNFWKQNAILDILKNPIYIGKLRWNHRQVQKTVVNGEVIKHRPHSKQALLTDGLHPAIVSNELFEQVNQRLDKRKRCKSGQKN